MNIHPIFVHFPIALLTLYTVFELLRVRALKRQTWWFPLKAVLLIVGVLGGAAALVTGNMAAETYEETSTMALVQVHSTLAFFSMVVYGLLALSYLMRWGYHAEVRHHLPTIWERMEQWEQVIFKVPVLVILSLVGLVLISMTGALGGAIVYGPDIDPVVSVVYHLFFAK